MWFKMCEFWGTLKRHKNVTNKKNWYYKIINCQKVEKNWEQKVVKYDSKCDFWGTLITKMQQKNLEKLNVAMLTLFAIWDLLLGGLLGWKLHYLPLYLTDCLKQLDYLRSSIHILHQLNWNGRGMSSFTQSHVVWKSQIKSHSTLRAKRAMLTFRVDTS